MTETSTPGSGGAAPIAEAIGVSKRYGATIALSDASLRVVAGESHALVGRNGAGKSTLVGILTGLREPDTGEVRFRGDPAPAIADHEGWRQRVACVYQHLTIVPDRSRSPKTCSSTGNRFSAASSIGTSFGAMPETCSIGGTSRSRNARARAILRSKLGSSSKSRALSYGARSHHLQEVYEVCQTVTVLRDAKHILTAPAATLPKDALIEAMTGEQVSFSFADAANRKALTEGSVALDVNALGGEDFTDVNFSVRAGEIIGLCGATSSGRLGVAEAVAGLRAYASGTILFNGAPLRTGDVPSALALGVGCFPKSRHRQGLVLTQSIADNVTMPVAKALGPLGFTSPTRRADAANDAIDTLGVVTQGPDQLVLDLSGGNQQKVVMGRALASQPSVLVLIDPTAGVDVKSKEALLRAVENTRREGRAILVASGELEDLRVCDRVLVMRHGKVFGEHAAGWSDNELVASVEGI